MDLKDLRNYYDDFVEAQQSSSINDRIYGLYKRLKKLGLNTGSDVLELGCGVGTMTYLLSKTVTKGTIEAVDISPRSISVCKQKIKKRNVRFVVADVVDYTPTVSQVDFITLFDVIEHIPVERHRELFENLHNICNDRTSVVINIPNPDYVQYDMQHHPEALQIIDQPIPLSLIVENALKSNLELIYFETYSVWVEDDYQFLLLRRKRDFKEKFLHENRSFFQKAIKKIARTLVRIKHSYHLVALANH